MLKHDIKLTHGSQTFKNASCKVNIFVSRGDGTDKRDFPNKVMEQIKGTHNTNSAALDGYKEHGTWYTSRFEAEEGKIITILASTTYRGSPYNNGCMLVVLRDDAPLIHIKVNATHNHNALYDNGIPAFTGRGDILELSELKSYGIVLPARFIANQFDEEELEELYSINTLASGTTRPKMIAVKTPEGSIRKVAVADGNKRKIRIRRK